jgi:hypothetical protein
LPSFFLQVYNANATGEGKRGEEGKKGKGMHKEKENL